MSSLLRAHLAHLRRTNARPATLRDRRDNLLRLERALGKDLADATYDDLVEWQDDLTRRVSVSTVCTYLANVQGFYRWAFEYEHLQRNPAARLIRPRKPATVPRPIPESDVSIAISAAHGQLFAILVLASYLGLRASEIASVRREDVLTEGRDRYLLVHGKGGKERTVPLVPAVWDTVAAWLSGGSRGPVFLNKLGEPADGRFITRAISAHMRGLGLPYTGHQLRHRFGTRLYRETRDLRLVQEVMGHASADQTAGYVQLGQARQQAGMSKLGAELVKKHRGRIRRGAGGGSAASAA